MVEHKKPFRSYETESDEFIENLTNSRPAPYKFGRTAQNDYAPDRSVPLFLSDPDGEPDPEDFVTPLRERRVASVSSKILLAVVAAAGAASLFAWFSSDATRDIIVNARASIASVAPTPATAQPDASKLTASDMQLKDTARSGAATPTPAPAPVVVANAMPSREDISSAYQSALRGTAPVAPPAAAAPPPVAAAPSPVVAAPQPSASPARQISGQELAMLINRAKEMLSAGDIPSARLFLERAAEAQDATAALLLARTYDPDVLGSSDVRNITPEPAKAHAWYEKAAQFGSAEAQRRLAQLPN
jgi:hypothetical protein